MTRPGPAPDPADSHRQRAVAEGFGTDAGRYDRARPRYPRALVDRIVAAAPGPDVLDVGIGTGILARQLREAGCRVHGVEPDARMAEFARGHGFGVDVATVEEWEPGGRTFDAAVAGMTWHWVDPVPGAAKVRDVLRPGGRAAFCWSVGVADPSVDDAFAAVYERVVPGVPVYGRGVDPVEGYQAFLDKAAAGMAEAGGFTATEKWRDDWDIVYTRDAWLDLVPTHGGHHLLPAVRKAELLAGLGAAVDAAGGSFTMRYSTLTITAVRESRDPDGGLRRT